MKVRLPKGMGGGPQNMNAMLRQAQKMQDDLAELTAKLEEKEYEVSAGGGAVTVKINGKTEIIAIELSPDIVDPDDVEILQDIIIAGVNEAIKRVNEDREQETAKITGPMNLPGMF